jgi:hypothetical protein
VQEGVFVQSRQGAKKELAKMFCCHAEWPKVADAVIEALNPGRHKVHKGQKGPTQLVISCGNASELFELIKPSMWPQLSSSLEHFFVFACLYRFAAGAY